MAFSIIVFPGGKMDIMVHDNVFLRYQKAEGKKGDIWFIHGYGDSGLSFTEAFGSVLSESFNFFVPDFPGFGVTPYRPGSAKIDDSTKILIKLIKDISKDKPIFIVAHSLGGIIGTKAAKELSGQVKAYVSIEGNMTREDTFATGLTKGYDDPYKFYNFFLGVIIQKIKDDEILKRFFASLRFSHPEALLIWGKDCVEATGNTKSGEEYAELDCDTLFIWGDKSLPKMTREFIEAHKIKNKEIEGSGHWPMIDNSDVCYEAIFEFFSKKI